jgi:hypothetical protein
MAIEAIGQFYTHRQIYGVGGRGGKIQYRIHQNGKETPLVWSMQFLEMRHLGEVRGSTQVYDQLVRAGFSETDMFGYFTSLPPHEMGISWNQKRKFKAAKVDEVAMRQMEDHTEEYGGVGAFANPTTKEVEKVLENKFGFQSPWTLPYLIKRF